MEARNRSAISFAFNRDSEDADDYDSSCEILLERFDSFIKICKESLGKLNDVKSLELLLY